MKNMRDRELLLFPRLPRILTSVLRVIAAAIQMVVTVAAVVMTIATVAIVEACLAQDPLKFLLQGFGDVGGMAFATGDAADVGRVDIQLIGDALVKPAKNRERLQYPRAIIHFCHGW
jgi:hypothetical protein